VVALDGIAVIANPANPVNTLTTAQIADVFAGKIHRWSELGGKDAPIAVHARDAKSGTYDTFAHLVLGSRPLAPEASRHESSTELSDAVAGDPGAIGFIGLRYVRSAKAIMVQDAGSVPLLPSALTVATEDYPLARRLYLYLPAKASAVAREFVDFALSDAGQKTVAATGFVDLRPQCDPEPAARCADCSADYREAVRGACRLSLDFRFDSGSTDLDTRAVHDLTRVSAVLEHGDQVDGRRSLVLLGFSDSTGSREDNVQLSKRRAAAVATQLRARGLRVDVARGLGPEMPVAANTTEEGRERNRRVEVWLR
jgi:phosphate transport system substrate-binding protein